MQPRNEELGKDVDGVAETLTLAQRILGVQDGYRTLGDRKPRIPDLLDDLGGVRHSVLPDIDRLCGAPREQTKSVVRVGQSYARAEPGRDNGETKQPPAYPRNR